MLHDVCGERSEFLEGECCDTFGHGICHIVGSGASVGEEAKAFGEEGFKLSSVVLPARQANSLFLEVPRRCVLAHI